MKKRILSGVFAFALSALCLLSGCQPTPDNPPVVNKNDGQLEEKMQATPAPVKPYEAPAHWSETEEGEKLIIVIDTDIQLPDVNAYPVVKLEPTAYTQQQIDDMVHYFVGDKPLYLPPVKTKADYDEEIIEAKRPPENEGDFFIIDWDPSERVKELEEKRAAAPDDSPVISADTTLTYKKDYVTGEDVTQYGKNFLSVCFENEDGGDGTVMANNYFKDGNFVLSPSFTYRRSDAGFVSESTYRNAIDGGESEEDCGWTGAGALFDKVAVNEQDAKAKAEQVIGDLNIKGLMLVKCEKAVSPNVPEKSGYELEYTRQNGGIAAYWFGGGRYAEGEALPAYSPPFGEEVLRFDISKDGIEVFSWWGYSHEVEKVSDNVALLPFEEVKQKLKNQIFYKKSFDDLADTVTVLSAELRMGYIGVKEKRSQALLIPVWVFETTLSFNDQGSSVQFPDDTYVLNAIDGGVIEAARY